MARKKFLLTREEADRRIANRFGQGVLADFRPFNSVAAGELSSRGVSAVQHWGPSPAHLLSNAEFSVAELGSMLPGLLDTRCQVLLHAGIHLNELIHYMEDAWPDWCPGTLELSSTLGVRHPLIRELKTTSPWPMTTDFVFTLQRANGRKCILAVACKHRPVAQLRRWEHRSLSIEREYWKVQGHDWLLFTPEIISPRYLLAVVQGAGFARATEQASEEQLVATAAVARAQNGRSLANCYSTIASEFGVELMVAKTFFWQAIWRHHLCIDIESTHWISNPLRVVSTSAFAASHPFIARRSAWTTAL